MKIDTTVKSPPPGRGKGIRGGQSQAPASPARGASVSDDVRLTSTSGKLHELESLLAEVEVADRGRVESIRQAIADGSFVVNEEVVAEGLIQQSIDNITHQPRE